MGGGGDGGEGTLPAICRRNTTNTHTPANGNPQQNKQLEKGPGLECGGEGGAGEVRGHLPGAGWPWGLCHALHPGPAAQQVRGWAVG